MIAYPLKFTPILQEKIWGGTKLKYLLNKASDKNNIGESWEVSTVKNYVSVVANGAYRGTDLQSLIKKFKADLVGEKVYKTFGNDFPLLIKFIDAKEALSIQLHPNDTLAKKRHNSFGKTEMWYVMQADREANLIVGFKEDCDKETYLKYLSENKINDLLNNDIVKSGDVYFIPTGRIHAIGAGILLAEIQQTSDITYRIYDWDRKDITGKGRELHTDLALEAIDYKAQKSYKTDYKALQNEVSSVLTCPYFTTNIINLNGEIKLDNSQKDTFIVYICTEGTVTLEFGKKDVINLNFGECVLVPNKLNNICFKSTKKAVVLEVFL
jgi:mannose-6-phosphate isomerase